MLVLSVQLSLERVLQLLLIISSIESRKKTAVCCEECVENKNSAAGHCAVELKSETYCWTEKLNLEDYGVHKYWVLIGF